MSHSPRKNERSIQEANSDSDDYTDLTTDNENTTDTETDPNLNAEANQSLSEPENGIHNRKATNASNGTRTTTTLSDESITGEFTCIGRLNQKGHLFTILSLLCFFLGIVTGFICKHFYTSCYWTPRRIMYVKYPAKIFQNILSSLKLPVAIASIVASIGSIDLPTFYFIGKRTVFYFIILMFLASSIGTMVTYRMGHRLALPSPECPDDNCGPTCPFWNQKFKSTREHCLLNADFYMDYARNFFPKNVIQAYIQTEQTRVDVSSPHNRIGKKYGDCEQFIKDDSANRPKLETFGLIHKWLDGSNTLGVFIVSAFFGLCTIVLNESSKPFLNICVSASEVFLLMATWALRLTPIGAFSSMMGLVLEHPSIFHRSSSFLAFLLINVLCQLLYAFVFLPLMYFLMTGKSPFKFYLSIAPILATAFCTCSSTGTIPMTIKSLEDNCRLDPRVVRFVVPICATIGAAGTVLLAASSVAFLLLRHDKSPTFLEQPYHLLLVFAMTLTLSTGGAIVGGDVISIPFILASLNFDPAFAFEIIPSLWIMDPFMTTSNVVGDCVMAAVINHSGRTKLRFLHEQEEKAVKEMELADANQQWGQGSKPPESSTITPAVIHHLDQTDV